MNGTEVAGTNLLERWLEKGIAEVGLEGRTKR